MLSQHRENYPGVIILSEPLNLSDSHRQLSTRHKTHGGMGRVQNPPLVPQVGSPIFLAHNRFEADHAVASSGSIGLHDLSMHMRPTSHMRLHHLIKYQSLKNLQVGCRKICPSGVVKRLQN